jgi:alkylation response protein AidB-like acyl-CoA dehydrogenase
MTLLDASELQELGQSVRSACERLATEERVREVAFDREGPERGYDAELWRTLCGQVGVTAIALPEELGGAGYGIAALGVVAHELGRVLAPVPFTASAVLATDLLLAADDRDAVSESLEALAAGERTAAAAITGDGGLWQRGNVSITAVSNAGRWSLTGSCRHVLHGGAADIVVVVATVDGEPAVFSLDADTAGLSVRAESVLDWTRPMATLEFSGAAAQRLTGDGPADDLITRSVERAIAVLSAEQVGANERVLEIAADYARTREQFGRPIGSFQAIKHKCADILVGLEWARSASQAALESVDADDGEVGWRTSMAKAVCSESLRSASHDNLQIHGGIGFTWEDSAHLYLKRARTDEVLFGSPGQHWDKLGVEAKLL